MFSKINFQGIAESRNFGVKFLRHLLLWAEFARELLGRFAVISGESQ